MRRRRAVYSPVEDLHESESDFGLSIGDLMSALLLIFVLLLSATLFKLHDNVQRALEAEKQARQAKEHIQGIALTYQTLQADLYKDLQAKFASRLKPWNAEIDPETISFRFNSPDVLFEQGKSEIKPEFKAILNAFFRDYLSVLQQKKYFEHIEEIRIEGHTSTEWSSGANQEDAYFGNMQLSQDRTRSVLQYSLSVIKDKPQLLNWCKQHITANGLSSSKAIRDSSGKEDSARSRRVEFRVRTDSEKQIQKMLLIQ
jgi:outer membrane protein OmpA-like peptidoglycan-associated protein